MFHQRITFQERKREKRLAVATAATCGAIGSPLTSTAAQPLQIPFESDFSANPDEFFAFGLIPIWIFET